MKPNVLVCTAFAGIISDVESRDLTGIKFDVVGRNDLDVGVEVCAVVGLMLIMFTFSSKVREPLDVRTPVRYVSIVALPLLIVYLIPSRFEPQVDINIDIDVYIYFLPLHSVSP